MSKNWTADGTDHTLWCYNKLVFLKKKPMRARSEASILDLVYFFPNKNKRREKRKEGRKKVKKKGKKKEGVT